MDTLQTIINEGLAIRRIPLEMVSVFEASHPNKHIQESRDKMEQFTRNGRNYCREVKIPKHAGWWMCKTVNDTGCIVRWDGMPNAAPTLQESVQLYMKNKES